MAHHCGSGAGGEPSAREEAGTVPPPSHIAPPLWERVSAREEAGTVPPLIYGTPLWERVSAREEAGTVTPPHT